MDEQSSNTYGSLQGFYRGGIEETRRHARGRLEYLRLRELLRIYLPPPPARVLDVGGGTGVHARDLKERGYQVGLVDPLPWHVKRASSSNLNSSVIADARALPYRDNTHDAVVMFGPIYHLEEVQERTAALAEAARVMKPGGLLLVAAISKYCFLIDSHAKGLDRLNNFTSMIAADLSTGVHRNPSKQLGWFTSSYLHDPASLRAEIAEGGLTVHTILAVESFAHFLPDLDARLSDALERERLLEMVRLASTEPSLLSSTGHLLAVAHLNHAFTRSPVSS